MAELQRLNVAQIRVLRVLCGAEGWISPREIADAAEASSGWHCKPGPCTRSGLALVDRGLARQNSRGRFQASAAGRRWLEQVRI